MSKENLERLEVSMSVNEKNDGTTDFSVKVDASCSLAFMASAFKALMMEDENIRRAMHVAVLDEVLQMFEKEKGSIGDINDALKSIFKKNKPQAQA